MRSRVPTAALVAVLFVLNPAAPPRLAAAAVGRRPAPTASGRLQREPAGPDSVELRTFAEYQAAYCYALACLAGMQKDPKDQVALLRQAQLADPTSKLLALERSELLVSLGQDGTAIEVLGSALALHPGDLELRRKLAGLYRQTGHSAQAEALFLKPGGGDPSDPEFLRSLAALDVAGQDFPAAERRLRLLQRRGATLDDRELLAFVLQRLQRYREAAAEYRAVLRVDGDRDSAWDQMAACEEASGDTVAAKADLVAGMKAVPDSPMLADQLGRFLYRTKDYAGAERAFSRLVAMDRSDVHSLFYRGLARLKIGRYREAEADFRDLEPLEKDDPDQAYALALALLMQKKYVQAGGQLERVLSLNPQAEDAWAELAFVDEQQKRPSDAIEVLKRGVAAMPDSAELALLLSEAQEDKGDLAAAEKTLRKSLDRGGGSDIRFQLAVLLDKRGRFANAEKELNILIEESPRYAEALNYLGYSWADRREKLPQAESLIRRALAVEPGNPYYLDSLGWVLHRQGRNAQALVALEKASKSLDTSSNADEAVVFDHLAVVLEKLGRSDAARSAKAQARKIRARARGNTAADSGAKGDLGL